MFTGIVQALGTIDAIESTDAGQRLIVQRGKLSGQVNPGDSISVSGVCLTVVDITAHALGFDVIHETLRKTSLGARKQGDAVNLEMAVTPSQPLGGHFMQGHVDGLAEVVQVHDDDGEWRISFTPVAGYEDLMDWIIPRGSIAIDGVSLTLARVSAEAFDVALIPATLELTTLGQLKSGSIVNIEADILAKTVVHQIQRMQSGMAKPKSEVTMALLKEAGFIKG